MDSRSKICELRRQDPSITQAAMAGAIGISRERVRQLLKSMRMPTVYQEPDRARFYNSPAKALDVAPVLLWIIEEMVRPPEGDRGIPRQMAQFRPYAEQVVAIAREAMDSDPIGWEKYLTQTGGAYARNESTR